MDADSGLVRVSELGNMSHCTDIFCRSKDVCDAYCAIARELTYEWTLLIGIQDNDDQPEEDPWYREQWAVFATRARHILRVVRRRYLDRVLLNADELYDHRDPGNAARFSNPFGTLDGVPFCDSQREAARAEVWDAAEAFTRAGIDFRQYWSNDRPDFLDRSADYASLRFDDDFLAREAERRRQRDLARPPLRDLTNLPRGAAARPDW